MLKKLLLAVAIFLPAIVSAQTLKIGLVDTNEVLMKLPDTNEAQQKLAEASKKYDDEYQKLGEEMKRRYEEIANMPADELPAIRERKTREFSEYQAKIQQFEQSAQEDLAKIQQELMMPIMQKVRSAIEAVSKEGAFSLVQEKNPQLVFYYDAPVIDLTDAVKQKLGITN